MQGCDRSKLLFLTQYLEFGDSRAHFRELPRRARRRRIGTLRAVSAAADNLQIVPGSAAKAVPFSMPSKSLCAPCSGLPNCTARWRPPCKPRASPWSPPTVQMPPLEACPEQRSRPKIDGPTPHIERACLLSSGVSFAAPSANQSERLCRARNLQVSHRIVLAGSRPDRVAARTPAYLPHKHLKLLFKMMGAQGRARARISSPKFTETADYSDPPRPLGPLWVGLGNPGSSASRPLSPNKSTFCGQGREMPRADLQRTQVLIWRLIGGGGPGNLRRPRVTTYRPQCRCCCPRLPFAPPGVAAQHCSRPGGRNERGNVPRPGLRSRGALPPDGEAFPILSLCETMHSRG